MEQYSAAKAAREFVTTHCVTATIAQHEAMVRVLTAVLSEGYNKGYAKGYQAADYNDSPAGA